MPFFFLQALMANKMQFRHPRWNISASRRKNFSSMSKNGKNLYFSQEENVFRLILWTKRKHLGQPFRIQTFADVAFRSMSENDLKNHFSSKVFLSSNFTVGHVECIFDFHVRIFLTIGMKIFAQSPRTMEEKFTEKTFPQSFLLDSDRKCSFEIHLGKFFDNQQHAGNFSRAVQKRLKK